VAYLVAKLVSEGRHGKSKRTYFNTQIILSLYSGMVGLQNDVVNNFTTFGR